MRRATAGTALAAAYATLAGLVAAGTLSHADQWAIDHLMPGGSDSSSKETFADAVIPLVHTHWRDPLDAVASLVTLPGQVVVSGLLVGVAALLLLARGRREAALVWPATWFAATAIEVLCKSTLARPALYRHGHHLVGYDASWPSGHTLRVLIVAATFAAVWPRARAALALWAAAALPLLVASGAHTPSDVAGGLLLVALLLLAAGAAERSALLRRALRGGPAAAAAAPRRP
ncbi:MAG TPA: phosphatase PAP2 family protein [Gaiellaceae bacterium]|nr:phosphatase PAP2 family protein [Gaiellaceae bacterium]